MATSSVPEWYETDQAITASVKIKGMDADVFAVHFTDKYCIIDKNNSPYMKCCLHGDIVPPHCKFTRSKLRLELKMCKKERGMWAKLGTWAWLQSLSSEQVSQPSNGMDVSTGPGDCTSSGPGDCTLNGLAGMCNEGTLIRGSQPHTSRPHTSRLHTSRLHTPTPNTPGSIPPGSTQEISLQHIRHEWHEMEDQSRVHLALLVPSLKEGSSKVTWGTKSVQVSFQSNFKELAVADTTFLLNIPLVNSIVPEQCFHIGPTSPNPWGAESPNPRGAELDGPKSMDTSGPLAKDVAPNNLSMKSDVQTRPTILSHTNIQTDQGKTNRVVPPSSNCQRGPITPPTKDGGTTQPLLSTLRNPYPAQDARNVDLNAEDPFNRSQRLIGPCLTGLQNLGNTCYMNSTLQCLGNTTCLRDFFITGSYLKDLNKRNVLGYNGELATSFCKMVRKLWSGEQQSFAPERLKDVIEKRHPNYDGLMQHDAHEFMSLLLDGLHEDLNRVTMKPLTEAVVSDGQSDVEVAKQAWKVHRMRNDSFLVDFFQGQFRSTLVCSECSKVSVTFDPFMTMSVPIPNNLRQLPVFFVPKEPDTFPTKYVLKLPPEANLELLKASVARKTGISMPQLRVFEAYKGKFQTMHSDNQKPIKSIGDNDIIIVAEVISPKEAKGRVVELNVIQRVQLPIFPKKCTNCGKVAEEGTKLLRCSKCKTIGYCNEACQRNDWSAHKLKCKSGVPSPVGLPFVISLPANKLTYKNITSLAEKFARRSVECKRCTSKASDGGDDSYVLTPANQYGEWMPGANAILDEGDRLLDIESKFLTMDWRNNPAEGLIAITEKATLEHREDPAASANAPRDSGPIKLEHCIELFTQPETLSKDEAWYCPSCKVHREATKQMSLWQVPSILIIHLKRFSYTNRRSKIEQYIEFPLRELDMTPYMLGDAAKLVTSANPPIYDLYAIANHYGNTYNGHYTTMVKPTGGLTGDKGEPEWLCYDDSNVWRIHERHVVEKDAYILFYMRRANVAR
ncbi:hypothetical protein EMCRGX_G026942 [Ephydatia muelleri]